MSLAALIQDADKIGLDCIEEAFWPTLVTSAIDHFPTTRFSTAASMQRLKGSTDFSDWTSASAYPLIGWEVTTTTKPEVAALALWRFSINYEVKIANRGTAKHNDGSLTKASRLTIRDCANAQAALMAIDDPRLTNGPYGIDHASLITGKQSGRTYCIGATPFVSDVTVTQEPALGADVWVGTFTGTMTIHVL